MDEPKPITSLPKFYLGLVVGILGLYGMVLDESWLSLVSTIFGGELLGNQNLKTMIELTPTILLIIGLALMLKARERKSYEEAP